MSCSSHPALQLPAGLRLRDAQPADAAAIAAIYNQAVRAGGSTMDTLEKSAADVEALMRALDNRECYQLLECDERLLGWGLIKKYSERIGYRFCCETAVYLALDQRRKGYGTLLKRAQLARCRELGYHHIVAKVMARNQASIAYNRRLGFEMVGIQKEIGYVNDRWEDVAILQLCLEQSPADPSRS